MSMILFDKEKSKVINWQGLMDSNHRMTESESVALPLGEAPIILAGVDGIKPPRADLESAVLSLN